MTVHGTVVARVKRFGQVKLQGLIKTVDFVVDVGGWDDAIGTHLASRATVN